MASHILPASGIAGCETNDQALTWRTAAHSIRRTVAQALCGLGGHDRYLHTEPGKVTLRCVSCGHDSPGWQTGRPAYQLTCVGDPTRHRMR